MTIKVEVYVPEEEEPLSLDDYAVYQSLLAMAGTYDQAVCLPDYFHLDNPKTGNKHTIGELDMRSN